VSESKGPGTIAWTDLAVPDAEPLARFYESVVGWRPEPVSMGDYDDLNMVSPATGQPAAGICHARGSNSDLPPVWLIYILVEDLEKSLAACKNKGGKVLVGPKGMGPGSAYAVIQDPAGAVAALYQSGE